MLLKNYLLFPGIEAAAVTTDFILLATFVVVPTFFYCWWCLCKEPVEFLKASAAWLEWFWSYSKMNCSSRPSSLDPLDLVDYLDSTFLIAFLGDSDFCNSLIEALAFKGFKGIWLMMELSFD